VLVRNRFPVVTKHHFAKRMISCCLTGLVLIAMASVAPAATASAASGRGNRSVSNGVSVRSKGSSSWRLQHTPQPPVPNGFIFDASCTGTGSCVGVGRHVDSSGVWTTLAEAWSGTSWEIQSTPDPAGSTDSELFGVSCVSTDACMAVGFYNLVSRKTRTLAETWNGTSWTIASTPNPRHSTTSELSGVSCATVDACTAVGFSFSHGKTVTLAEAWDGTTWSIQTTPAPSGEEDYLQRVSCAKANACTAVGYSLSSSGVGTALAEARVGASWRIETTPDPKGALYVSLSDVSCTASAACTAVGSYTNSSGDVLTLAEVRAGSSWSVQTTPNPTGATGSGLSAVTCTASDACTAVGSYSNAAAQTVTLAEAWDGSSWKVQAAPDPVGADLDYFEGVGCTGAASCVAVGYDIASSGIVAPFAEAWDGSSWSIQAIPNPTGDITSELYGISCSASGDCAAVGSYYIDTSGFVVTLAETWNGSSWKVQATPNPEGTTLSALTGVSCTAGDSCTAVGYYGSQSGLATLAETWNGSSWRIQQTPDVSGATESDLSGVSCSSRDSCTAVGYYVNSARDTVTLAEVWNGTSWTKEPTPDPDGATTSELSSVACTASDSCDAIGYSVNSSGVGVTLAEGWDGTSWKIQTTPNPEGAVRGSFLQGVSCPAADSCTADGYDTNSSGVESTLAEGWDGTSWKIQTTPSPGGADESQLSSVSCTPAGDCTAVGFYTDSSGSTVTLAESRVGSSWKVESTANPTDAPVSELLGASCTVGTCHAIGFHTKSTGIGATLGEATG
jgi:hypothetical protein